MSPETATELGSDTGAFIAGEGAKRRARHEGVRAGVLGAAAVWAWVFINDLLQHTAFNTPVQFGRWFVAIDSVTALPKWGDVLAFTILLVAVWIGFGRAAAGAVRSVPRTPAILILAVLLLAMLQIACVVIATMLTAMNMGVSAWRNFYVAQLIGWAVVWWYLLRRHPEAIKAWRMAGRD